MGHAADQVILVRGFLQLQNTTHFYYRYKYTTLRFRSQVRDSRAHYPGQCSELSRKSLAILETAQGGNDVKTVESLNHPGDFLLKMGDIENARPYNGMDRKRQVIDKSLNNCFQVWQALTAVTDWQNIK